MPREFPPTPQSPSIVFVPCPPLSLTFFVWPKPYTKGEAKGGLRMQVIYLDSLALLNFLLDYLLLLLTGRVAGEALRRWRIALGAALGSLYAAAIIWPGWEALGHPVIRLGAGVLMVLAAYSATRRLLRLILLFFALSAALGGGIYALGFLTGGGGLLNGVVVPGLDVKLILLFGAGAYCVLSVVGQKLARHGPRQLRQVEVRLGDRRARLTALVDSGNTLSDPMTGKGVMVAEGARLAPLLPTEADFCHPAQCFPLLREPQRFRLLPYRAVGVDQGLLLAVKADAVLVDGRDTGSRLVALSPTPVGGGGGYQALLFEE